jgi:hypothetical protein
LPPSANWLLLSAGHAADRRGRKSTILLQVLQNLVNLLGIPSSLNFAVIGGVILIGVLADQQFMRYRQRRAGLRASIRQGAERARRRGPAGLSHPAADARQPNLMVEIRRKVQRKSFLRPPLAKSRNSGEHLRSPHASGNVTGRYSR